MKNSSISIDTYNNLLDDTCEDEDLSSDTNLALTSLSKLKLPDINEGGKFLIKRKEALCIRVESDTLTGTLVELDFIPFKTSSH